MKPIDERHAIVESAIEKEIATGREIGVQVAAYLDGKLVIDTWAGLADPETGRKVDGDTLFNVYSVTKSITVTALHVLADRGLIDYDATVASYWPEYGCNGKEKTTVRHVITHRAGVPQMPAGVTVERMCDWDWMTEQIAALTPVAEPGTKALYQAMTFGWLVGELVRRTDPQHRHVGRFVKEEIADPLGITDLWIGLPTEQAHRIARHVDDVDLGPQPEISDAATPPHLQMSPIRYAENDAVRRAGIPAVGGLFNARSCSRFYAMLAQGGELDGVRILSKPMVESLHVMRDNPGEPDEVMYNVPIPMTIGGFWLGGPNPPTCSAKSPRAICHPGFGNNIAWADPDLKLAVSICHNHMYQPRSLEEDAILPIANSVRDALDLS